MTSCLPEPEKLAISIVVPAYRKAGVLDRALRRLMDVFDAGGLPYEVIVVVDGDVDGSMYVLEQLPHQNLNAICLPTNYGKGYALAVGYRESAAALVGYIDADLDIHPSALLSAFRRLQQDPSLVAAVGSKLHPDSRVSYPAWRRVLSGCYRTICRLALGVKLGDTQSGLKAFRRDELLFVLARTSTTGFAFDLEILARLSQAGGTIAEVPIELDYQFNSSVGLGAARDAVLDIYRVKRSISNSR